MNKRSLTLWIILLTVLLVSACAPQPLTPIIIRITATPAPRTDTPEPTPPPPTATLPADAVATEVEEEPTEAAPAPTDEPAVEGQEVEFNWVTPLSTIEEFEPIREQVNEFDGVLSVSGNENSIRITYDPAVTSVETLMEELERIGQEVELVE